MSVCLAVWISLCCRLLHPGHYKEAVTEPLFFENDVVHGLTKMEREETSERFGAWAPESI